MAHVITDVHAWQALDSRGDPTIAARIAIGTDGVGVALAPAGASAGRHEAVFLRDGTTTYGGRSVDQLIHRVLPGVREALIGLDAGDPHIIDQALHDCDGTSQWSNIGGNVSTAVSVAAWLAEADARHQQPWQVIADWTSHTPTIPLPMVNIVSGGAHAGGAVDIQDVLAIPLSAKNPEAAIAMVSSIRSATRSVMDDAGFSTALVADEGGLAAKFANNAQALDVVHQGIRRAGLIAGVDAGIALDIAANQFETDPGHYAFDAKLVTSSSLVSIIEGWIGEWNVISVEDPLAEDDDWQAVREMCNRIQVVGDDRYATSQARLAQGISSREANTILIKPNQAGSLMGAIRTLVDAQAAGWRTIVSARSGETEQSWLVDLAVGSNAGQIKVGSTMRSERTAKWNRMLELSATQRLPYVGQSVLAMEIA